MRRTCFRLVPAGTRGRRPGRDRNRATAERLRCNFGRLANTVTSIVRPRRALSTTPHRHTDTSLLDEATRQATRNSFG